MLDHFLSILHASTFCTNLLALQLSATDKTYLVWKCKYFEFGFSTFDQNWLAIFVQFS